MCNLLLDVLCIYFQEGDIFSWKLERVKANTPVGGYVVGSSKPKDRSAMVRGKRKIIKNKKYNK